MNIAFFEEMYHIIRACASNVFFLIEMQVRKVKSSTFRGFIDP